MPCSSNNAANPSPQTETDTSNFQTPNPGSKDFNDFYYHQQNPQHQQQLQSTIVTEYDYGLQAASLAPFSPAFVMTADINQQHQRYFIPSTASPDLLSTPSAVYANMPQHPQQQKQPHMLVLQQQLQPPIQYQVSAPTSPVTAKGNDSTVLVRSASAKRPHPAGSDALNDQKLSDQRSPQYTRPPARKRGDSNVSIKSLRKRGDSNASSISSQSPRYPASSGSTTVSSSEARSSSYTKKAAEFGSTRLGIASNSAISAGGSPNALPTQSAVSPQRRKTNLINFSIANGRAVVSSTEGSLSVASSREPSPVSSPENSNDDEDESRGPVTSRPRADDAIIALKEVIARAPFGLDRKPFNRSRAKSVPVPVAVATAASSGIGAMSAATLTTTTTPVGPSRKKTVDPTPPPYKKRVCKSAVHSPPRPPISPSYMQSPHTNLNSPASISGPSPAIGLSRSPVSEIGNSPRVFIESAKNPAVQIQSLPLQPPQLQQHQPVPQQLQQQQSVPQHQQQQLMSPQQVGVQQLAPENEALQFQLQQQQEIQNEFQLQLRQQQYFHQQMLSQQLTFPQHQQHQQPPFEFQPPSHPPPSSIITTTTTAFPQPYPHTLPLPVPQQQQQHIILNEGTAGAYYGTTNTNFLASPPQQQSQQTIAFPVYSSTPVPASMDSINQYYSSVYPQQHIPIDLQQHIQRQQHLQ